MASPASRRSLSPWTVPLVAAAVLLIAGAALACLWWWVDGQQWSDQERKTSALLDVVKVASGIAVGGGGLFALYLAARRQRTQELELAQREIAHELAVQVASTTEQDAASRRVTDLYAKAVEQLGSDKAPVRLGGLYALERLAQDNPAQRQTIVNVLCAYLRMPFELPAPTDTQKVEEREVRYTAQRILTAHLRPDLDATTGEPTNPDFWPGRSLDLAGATLIDFDASYCHFDEAAFDRATFTGEYTSFSWTTFTRTAGFSGAQFTTEALFHEATFAGTANFIQTMFADRAIFPDTSFAKGEFSSATFTADAAFDEARFGDASFTGARFKADVSFDGARFIDDVYFKGATFAGTTTFDEALASVDDAFRGWPVGWTTENDHDPAAEGWQKLVRVPPS